MRPEDYPVWLKKQLKRYDSPCTEEELISYLPEIINDSVFKNWIETKNPLYVWDALGDCLKYNLEIPNWVKKYFLECAKSITKIDSKKRNETAPLVYKALSMSTRGRGTVFSRFKDRERQSDAGRFVYFFLEAHPNASKEEAFAEVASILHQSEETIKKWYQKYCRFIYKADNEFPPAF